MAWIDGQEVNSAATGAGLGTLIGGPGVGTAVGAGAGWLVGGGGKQLYDTVSGNKDNITGTVSPQQQQQYLNQVQGPDQSAYQIPGTQDYQNTLQGLQGQVPGGQDFQGANAADMGNQQALQAYFQNVAMGKQPTAADQLFQNAQAQAGQQLQSGMLSQGGMNPALGMRQMANSQAGVQGQIASKSAAQKYQEQQKAGELAQAGSQAMVVQRMAQMNATYNEQMQGVQAKSDIANKIWDSSRQQTSLNVEYAQNRTSYQQFMYGQRMQGAKDQAAGNAAMIRMLAQSGTQMGAAGIQAYGGRGGTQPGAPVDPNAAAIAQSNAGVNTPGGSGSYQDPFGTMDQSGNAGGTLPQGGSFSQSS